MKERAELGMRSKKVTISEYINNGLYAITRKCPTFHLMLGYDSVWDLRSTQFKWVIENLSEEFKERKKQ